MGSIGDCFDCEDGGSGCLLIVGGFPMSLLRVV
jgi:hypothetical protein